MINIKYDKLENISKFVKNLLIFKLRNEKIMSQLGKIILLYVDL